MKKLFEHFDHTNNTLYKQYVEDVEPVLEENALIRNAGTNGFSPSRNFRKIASIPLIIVEKVLREKGINLMENSPEAQRYLRKFLRRNPKFMTVDKL